MWHRTCYSMDMIERDGKTNSDAFDKSGFGIQATDKRGKPKIWIIPIDKNMNHDTNTVVPIVVIDEPIKSVVNEHN